MAVREIRKSFHLDSEPVLHWPESPTKLEQIKGFRLEYSGNGMAYSLRQEKTGSVKLVGWDPEQRFVGWRNIFSEPQLRPSGLIKLAQLDINSTAQAVCEWASTNGLLGFRPTSNPVKRGGPFIPIYFGNSRIHHYEPIDCIRKAAQRAANVLELWAALKKSYATGQGHVGVQAIRSVITIREDTQDSAKVGSPSAPIQYRTFVNGEARSRWPVPKSPREWRELANVLLSEYIQEHIRGEIEIAVGVQAQNKDEEERHTELPPDWNLKPAWRIQSALAAYYVELLMVMRRFRSCKTCGKDISHQRNNAIYCTAPSTCRSKNWHRRNAAMKNSS